MKKRIVVVCPGRGSYTKDNLGYLRQFGGKNIKDFVNDLDERRKKIGEPTISELDNADAFKPNIHTRGEHASTLIYACSFGDFMTINRDKYEIVAVTGNSMGWYLALAYGGSFDRAGGFQVINTMGSMMKDGIIGGQVIYPLVDDQWVRSSEKVDAVNAAINEIGTREGHEVYASIYLGGYIVLGGNKAGISALLKDLPKVDDYPFQLINHAAFHTPLLKETSEKAFATLPQSIFHKPKLPMIDGRGFIWQPYSTQVDELYKYTFGHQVTEPYDFTKAIAVALKEFAPDHLVLLGPGSSLGGSIGQILIENNWRGLKSKDEFTRIQADRPLLIAMGRPDQRPLIS